MEISEHDLGRLVAEIDEEHRAGMRTAEAELSALADRLSSPRADERRATDQRSSRRRFLRRAAFGGVAVAAGGAIVSVADLFTPAFAADQAPSDGDVVAFAESVERALASSYGTATSLTAITNASVRTTFATFAAHHTQHANALSTLSSRIGANSKHQPNPKLLEIANGQFQAARDENAVLDVGFLLESGAAASYLVALGTLQQDDAQTLTASILPVESQHAEVFGSARGKALTDTIPTFITTDRAMDPTKYPPA